MRGQKMTIFKSARISLPSGCFCSQSGFYTSALPSKNRDVTIQNEYEKSHIDKMRIWYMVCTVEGNLISMKKIAALLALPVIFSFFSCGSQGILSGDQTVNPGIFGSWELTWIYPDSGTTLKAGFPDKKPTLVLEGISGKFTGNNGCNQYFGNFKTNNNAIDFGDAGVTMMFCDGVNEKAYMDAFNSVKSYQILNKELVLLNNSGQELLKFAKK